MQILVYFPYMLRLTKKPRLNLTKSAGDWGERVHKIEDWRDRWYTSKKIPIYLELSLAQFSSKLSKKKIELLIVVYTLSLSRI